jgi:hypothetical protein
MASIARGMAGMVFYLNDGQLLPLIQQAIAVNGHLKNQDKLSEYMLGLLTTLHRKNAEERGEIHRGQKGVGPVIAPDQVFSGDH